MQHLEYLFPAVQCTARNKKNCHEDVNEKNEPARKKARALCRTNLSVCMPCPLRSHMFSSFAEVSPWSAAYMSEQHMFRRNCADVQARLNRCCSHIL